MLSRRRFLLAGAAITSSLPSLPASAALTARRERDIFLINAHTGESLKTVYWADGRYESGALQRLNYLMRDHYSDEVHRMDPRLIDLLWHLRKAMGTHRPFELFSGYRSPATNAMLAQSTEGVAAHSLHMQGQAADIRVQDTRLHGLARLARGLRLGGVGSYATFVHVDTGPVRYW